MDINHTLIEPLENCIIQTIMEPTHQDNILDLLLTTDPSSIEKESVQDGISDHGIVITDINLKANKMGKYRGMYIFMKSVI